MCACKHCSIKLSYITEQIEVADEFITSRIPELMRFFIIKPRHPGRLKKQAEKTALVWEPWPRAEKLLLP